MHPEVHDPEGFYATPAGIVAKRLLRARLRQVWPERAEEDVLGLGHAGPFLRLWRRRARRLVSAVPLSAAAEGPAQAEAAPWDHPRTACPRRGPDQGGASGREAGHAPHRGEAPPRIRAWPPDGPNAQVAVEEEALPFPGLSFDAVLMVHGLETAENARRLLREVWRVLRDDGRLLVVVPNRRSIWAHLERTPFAQGTPYSPGQISRLLRRSLFSVEQRVGALWIPPFRSRALLGGAMAWERAGRAIAPKMGGVIVIEARKELFGAVPAGALAPAGRRVVRTTEAAARAAGLPRRAGTAARRRGAAPPDEPWTGDAETGDAGTGAPFPAAALNPPAAR